MQESDKYKIVVNEYHTFDVTEKDLTDMDMLSVGEKDFHVIKDHISYNLKIKAFDLEAKQVTVEVNGTDYEVQINNQYDELVSKLGLTVASAQVEKDIKAPMPGLVLDVKVKIGDTVNEGDGLLILEAMKMENVIKSSGEGVVKSIHIKKGKTVDKGELLIEME